MQYPAIPGIHRVSLVPGAVLNLHLSRVPGLNSPDCVHGFVVSFSGPDWHPGISEVVPL